MFPLDANRIAYLPSLHTTPGPTQVDKSHKFPRKIDKAPTVVKDCDSVNSLFLYPIGIADENRRWRGGRVSHDRPLSLALEYG